MFAKEVSVEIVVLLGVVVVVLLVVLFLSSGVELLIDDAKVENNWKVKPFTGHVTAASCVQFKINQLINLSTINHIISQSSALQENMYGKSYNFFQTNFGP